MNRHQSRSMFELNKVSVMMDAMNCASRAGRHERRHKPVESHTNQPEASARPTLRAAVILLGLTAVSVAAAVNWIA